MNNSAKPISISESIAPIVPDIIKTNIVSLNASLLVGQVTFFTLSTVSNPFVKCFGELISKNSILNVHDIKHGAYHYGKDWVHFGLLAAPPVNGLWLSFAIHLIHCGVINMLNLVLRMHILSVTDLRGHQARSPELCHT